MGISRELQRDPTIMLTESMIGVVVSSVTGLADSRGWRLYAVEAVASHLHTVIGAALPAVAVLEEIRGETLRCLAARGLHGGTARFWSGGGHFSTIHTIPQLERAVEYANRHRRHQPQ
ncbi:MAG: hypothetical protein JWM10_4419 [Myxococcaceae bacterium]|nr:hypothetical protein [Myxococcaceae bacterium]